MVKSDAKEPTPALKIEQVSIDDLTPDPTNPRRITDAELEHPPEASPSPAWSICHELELDPHHCSVVMAKGRGA